MNDRRRGLGRGLGALIPAEPGYQARPTDVFFATHRTSSSDIEPAATPSGSAGDEPLKPVPGAHFAEIDVTEISPNPRQPRVEDRKSVV